MQVTILSPTHTDVDGINYGNPIDAAVNNQQSDQQLPSKIQLALEAYINDLIQQAADVPGLRSQVEQLTAELEQYRNPPQPEQNYVGLYNGLLNEGLSLFLFVRAACDVSLPVSNAYTDLVAALLTPQPSLPPLQSCIDNVFAAMASAGFSFSPEQTAQMRSLLDSYGFASVVFPLGV